MCAKLQGEKCRRDGECDRGLKCDGYFPIDHPWYPGTCLKVEGKPCKKSEECALDLECKMIMEDMDPGFGLYKKTCITRRKSQYFWLVRFGPKVGQIRLILDKFVFFLNRTKMKCV